MTIKIRKEEIKQKLREIGDLIAVAKKNLPSNINEFLHLGLVKDGIYKKIVKEFLGKAELVIK